MHFRALMGAALAGVWLAATACGDDGGDNGQNGTGNPEVDAILALTGDPDAGETTYLNVCGNAICHGADGVSGPGGNLAVIVPDSSDAQIVTVVIEGEGSMPAQNIEDQAVADVLAYLRATFP